MWAHAYTHPSWAREWGHNQWRRRRWTPWGTPEAANPRSSWPMTRPPPSCRKTPPGQLKEAISYMLKWGCASYHGKSLKTSVCVCITPNEGLLACCIETDHYPRHFYWICHPYDPSAQILTTSTLPFRANMSFIPFKNDNSNKSTITNNTFHSCWHN